MFTAILSLVQCLADGTLSTEFLHEGINELMGASFDLLLQITTAVN